MPWLARTWKWSNGNKTLTLNLAQNVKWSDGTPLTSADVVYSLKGGTGAQSKVMDILGYTRPDSNVASITAKGPNAVVIKLKTVDSQFISSTLNTVVHRAEAHLVEGREPGHVHQPASGWHGAVHDHRPLHDAGLRVLEEPALLAGRQAADRLPRVRAGVRRTTRPSH